MQVTDAIDGSVRVRMLVSAPIAALFDLRCDVREGMVDWLQRTNPGALPRRRIEHETEPALDSSSRTRYLGEPKAGSGLSQR